VYAGQHQYRQARLFRAPVSQHADAIQLWQVQVQNYNVIVQLSYRIAGLLPIRKNVHRVVLAFKSLANESGQRLIVLPRSEFA
jgi:hypothetical protein